MIEKLSGDPVGAPPQRDLARFIAFAALTSVALSAFGVQVCPYLHGFGARSVGVVYG